MKYFVNESKRKRITGKRAAAHCILFMVCSAVPMNGVTISTTSASEPAGNTKNTVVSGKRAVQKLSSSAQFSGMCYSPFRDREDPNSGIFPDRKELREDIFFISKLTNSIRTYGITDSLSMIPGLCQEAGITCYPGIWISRNTCANEREIRSALSVANQNLSSIKGFVVGNEVLLREDIPENELIGYIDRVRESTGLPVGTADTWKEWTTHPQLVKNVDFMFVHIHPYWDSLPVDQAAAYVVEKWEMLKTLYPEKTIIIGETGWPTQGDTLGEAVPSQENQKKFLSDFLSLADEKSIPYFYFEVFDEQWKETFEGATGNHWGVYYSNGSLKPLLQNLVPEGARTGIDRQTRELLVTPVTLPLTVYIDGNSPEKTFYPSGFMGDLAGLTGDTTMVLDECCTESPHSGESCVRITYIPGSQGWGGIYWQYPVNNWGDYPGYAITEQAKLTFWARGRIGGEKAEFKTGGINTAGKSFHDSFGPETTGSITLTENWTFHTIDLKGKDLSMIIGGFCWTALVLQNPNGCTIYLDDIQFVPLLDPPYGVKLQDIPDDNGHRAKLSWYPSLSEKSDIPLKYRIYRSRSASLTDPILLSTIPSIEELKTLELYATILIDTVDATGGDSYEYIDATIPVNNETYYYWVQTIWEYGESEKIPGGYMTIVEDELPEFTVYSPYPNPFNSTCTIQYMIPHPCRVELTIFDILGHKIAALESGMEPAGFHESVWNGTNHNGLVVGAGIYLYQITAGNRIAYGKLLLLK